jgi:hypothetical protein
MLSGERDHYVTVERPREAKCTLGDFIYETLSRGVSIKYAPAAARRLAQSFRRGNTWPTPTKPIFTQSRHSRASAVAQ